MWFHSFLTNKMIYTGQLAELIGDFFLAFVEKGRLDDMALFAGRTVYDQETKQLITRVYFSPACINHFPPMALRYFATACEKPDKGELTLLVGPENAFDLIDMIYVTIETSSDKK